MVADGLERLQRVDPDSRSPDYNGQRIALITFAGSAAVRVPLTLDHGFVRYILERADPSDMDVGSTSLQAAGMTNIPSPCSNLPARPLCCL